MHYFCIYVLTQFNWGFLNARAIKSLVSGRVCVCAISRLRKNNLSILSRVSLKKTALCRQIKGQKQWTILYGHSSKSLNNIWIKFKWLNWLKQHFALLLRSFTASCRMSTHFLSVLHTQTLHYCRNACCLFSSGAKKAACFLFRQLGLQEPLCLLCWDERTHGSD